jgi:large subunit ribosomal protein L31
MKKDIHPDYHPVLFVDSGAGFEFASRSTLRSDETRDVDGVEHHVIRLEISSASHPFFTGRQHFVDTAGRIEKFQRKYGGEKKK